MPTTACCSARGRIFTTGGGDILVWSSQGDINAGIGARTTIVYDPPLISYDAIGGQTVDRAGAHQRPPASPPCSRWPGWRRGNVDLIAPAGTIDAGEAGIRVSGNLNIAGSALREHRQYQRRRQDDGQ